MGACALAGLVMMFKAENETIDVPLLVRFFGLQLLFSKNFTGQGKIFRRRYWQLFGLAFIFGALTFLTINLSVPEFSQEFNQARVNA